MSIIQRIPAPTIPLEEARAVMEQIHEHILFCRKAGATPTRVVVNHRYYEAFLRGYRALAARLVWGDLAEILGVPVWVDYCCETVFRIETDRDPC